MFVGAILLIVGGALAATVDGDAIRAQAQGVLTPDQTESLLLAHRIGGVLVAAAGLGIGYLTAQARRGDERYRRSGVVLSVATVFAVLVITVFLGSHLLTIIGMLPIIVGALMLTRPAARAWFAERTGHQGYGDLVV
ncbi:hypothetical protein CQY22_000710 [Mycolicibacterium brumae]|uniref:Uncharacterized protein n=2 Tax=Mycolicibacterium brumae TaxID=85968 RepID=A0A2G5PHL6_9MYCO|nr:hypothetical protein CQY22_000710 [Mycolicibacterium brumae]RWA18531.1 hypothetical protein MBRU_04750 [Mycolicibacterium brumae DSM 44177]